MCIYTSSLFFLNKTHILHELIIKRISNLEKNIYIYEKITHIYFLFLKRGKPQYEQKFMIT